MSAANTPPPGTPPSLEHGRSLEGRVALVTGAAKRIGRTIALELARHGAAVAITYRTSAGEARTTVAEIETFGVAASSHFCDLDDPASIAGAVEGALERHKHLDLLVNNAGMFGQRALEAITPNEWDTMFAANTRGPFLVARACYPHLKSARGRIVNIGSLGGIHPWATHGHYCTSKAAVHMLSNVMAKAWAPEISVNCVAPGMIVEGEVDEAYQHFAEKTPMRRNGTAEDVAAAVAFFAAGPHFITGQLLAVDGGLGL